MPSGPRINLPIENKRNPMAEGNSLNGLLDIELEANIRFGAREMSLAELLEVGPGAVIPLDRQVNDPVDLIIGDKVVARGEVVLVQGKFGLRVAEVISG
jgi:flagellar motor switch protein FliN